MANEEHIVKLKEGSVAWNGWRKANPGISPDLSGTDLRRLNLSVADLRGANLSGADLTEALLDSANLEDANLTRAVLVKANLFGAHLRAADLDEARLDWVDLRQANLSHARLRNVGLHGAILNHANLGAANLIGAELREATLIGAYLTGSDLSRAGIGSTTFDDNDLSEVKGLDTIRHYGPSPIGVTTIYRSRGRLPEVFLRGAGVPEIFIEYLPSLVAPGAIQFHSCFISYSTKDQEFADRLYADLQNKGVRCWFAPHDVQGGKKLHEQIDEAIRRYERLLLILSPNSMSSKWVKTEIRNARKREVAEKKRVLFPVRLASYEALRE